MSDAFDAVTQAWIDEKHPAPTPPPSEAAITGAAEAIAAARARAEATDEIASLFRTESEPARGADTTLAAQIAPQMSLATGDTVIKHKAPGLADKFVAPPFSVLDTRAGYWQERRRSWLSLGLRSEVGRAEGLIYQHDAPASDPGFYAKKTAVERELGREISIEEFRRDHYKREEQDLGQSGTVQSGTSVFDPVLCEIAYRWFSGPAARILDPFAGGAVRGVVAGILGRHYVGVELRGSMTGVWRRWESNPRPVTGGIRTAGRRGTR